MDGVLAVNKPKGMTSHDVVARVRRVAKTRRVGHCGTLDPMAEGVLICCLNRATRIVPWLTGLPKEYTGEIVLGASSDTYDAEGRIVAGIGADGFDDNEASDAEKQSYKADDPELAKICLRNSADVTEGAILDVFNTFSGMIDQAAPPYSAVRVDGKRLHELARKGEKVPRKVRSVWIEKFEALRYRPPVVTFLARVGSGTYIRSLAHDSGVALGCGGYLRKLVRTQVSSFHLDDTVDLALLETDPDALSRSLLSISQALGYMPKCTLVPEAEERLHHGGAFMLTDILECETAPPVGSPVLVLTLRGDALAVVEAEVPEGPFRPVRVLSSGAPEESGDCS